LEAYGIESIVQVRRTPPMVHPLALLNGQSIPMKGRFRLLVRLLRGALLERNGARVPWTPKRLMVMSLFLPAFLATQLVHWIGLFLDEIFFRGYRSVDVREPVFIVGVPRSGTTLLHRVLAQDSERYTTFTLGELLFAPSVTERVVWRALGRLDRCIGSPCGKLIALLERGFFQGLDAIHRSKLRSPEEDYFALTPAFACFLLILPFPSSGMLWQLAYFDDEVPPAEKRRIMAFYRSCLQRHLYVHGREKTLLSKNPSFTSAIGSLRETFPDCKVICSVRNPLDAIPSLLSSMRQGTRLFYGARHVDVLRDRFLDVLRHYYRHSLSVLPTWPRERHALVTLEELGTDVRAAVERIYDRFGYVVSPSYGLRLEKASREAQGYQSRHEYSLEQFGLQPSTIVEDFSYVFERFGFRAPARETCEAGR
jgi:hypothetical protein